MQNSDIRELPNSPDSEAVVIGAIIMDETGDAADTAATLHPDAFYNPAHRQIFAAISVLHEAGEPIELPSLANQLNHDQQLEQIGGVSYLARLAHAVPTAADIGYYIGILQDKYTLRQIIRAAQEQITLAHESDNAGEVVLAVQTSATIISDQATSKEDFKPIREVGLTLIDSISQRVENRINGVVTGRPSGFTDLDKLTNGFQDEDLIIVAARPSVGKTAFALNIAQNVAKLSDDSIAVFSLEMSAEQLVQRMVCAESNLDANDMRTGDLTSDDDWAKLTMGLSALSDRNIFIDDTGTITVHEIRSKCRRLKKEKGLGMIVIDYLQLIQGSGKRGLNREQEVSEISRTLKQIARELKVPVIALSQLSRGVEQRQDKRPMLSDLRESGAIEQDADIVAFLYRDDYYNADTEKKNIIEIIIAKQRNGPVGTAELLFLKNFNKFVNYDRAHAELTPPPAGDVKDIDKRKWA